MLPTRAAVAVFEFLATPAQRRLAAAMAPDDLALLMNDMADDDRTLFLSELPALGVQPLLNCCPPTSGAAPRPCSPSPPTRSAG